MKTININKRDYIAIKDAAEFLNMNYKNLYAQKDKLDPLQVGSAIMFDYNTIKLFKYVRDFGTSKQNDL